MPIIGNLDRVDAILLLLWRSTFCGQAESKALWRFPKPLLVKIRFGEGDIAAGNTKSLTAELVTGVPRINPCKLRRRDMPDRRAGSCQASGCRSLNTLE